MVTFKFWAVLYIICLCSWIRSYLPPKKYWREATQRARNQNSVQIIRLRLCLLYYFANFHPLCDQEFQKWFVQYQASLKMGCFTYIYIIIMNSIRQPYIIFKFYQKMQKWPKVFYLLGSLAVSQIISGALEQCLFEFFCVKLKSTLVQCSGNDLENHNLGFKKTGFFQ